MRERVLHLTREDFTWQTFSAGGKGGQNQNRRSTGVRCIHEPSGARGESREYRTQLANKRAAFNRMAKSKEFQTWVRTEHLRVTSATYASVEAQLREEDLVIEYGPFA